jgi:probable HAF family extracellular repeat protein
LRSRRSSSAAGGSTVSADGPTRAFLFDTAAGTILNLGTLGDNPSTAFDVNNNGRVVGQAGGAFLWEDGVMLDLNDLIDPASGWTLSYASGINDLGLIVGQGDNPAGESHAFLLVPLDGGQPNPIPLPPAAWPALATMAGVAAWRLRRGSPVS